MGKEKVHDTESFEPAEIVNTNQKHENIQTPLKDEEIIISTPYVREKKVETTEEINLSNKDLIGKSDPYVFVQYGNKKFKSQTVKANLNPVWDYAIEIDLNEQTSDEVVISVYDKDIGRNDLMGSVNLSVKEIKELKKVAKKTVPLNYCKSGKIVF